MPSLFYKAIFERRLPLTFLFFEDMELAAKEMEEDADEEVISRVIRTCLERCYPDRKIRTDDVLYAAARLEALIKVPVPDQEDKDKKGKKGSKVDFASSFADWAEKLEPHQTCMAAAHFDYFMARRLYCEVDREDVVDLSIQWLRMEWEKVKVGYESVVYGFGGGFKSGPAGELTEVDVKTEDHTQGEVISASALAAVKF